MGRKRKMKVETVGEPLHRVYRDTHKPPIGGFLSFQEAFLWASNNIDVKAGLDKEKELSKRIEPYHKTVTKPVYDHSLA